MQRCETSVRPAPSSSSVVTFHWPFQSATLKRLLRMWECEQSEQVANTQIVRPNVCLIPARRAWYRAPGVCVIGHRSTLVLHDIRQRILPPSCILIYLLNVIMGLSDVLGDACHLHLFPVFTSAIDSCAPIFIKPLFHSFPPVICLSLPTHTTPSSLLSLSSTSPQMSLSTHLLSPGLNTGANTQPSVFCLRR